MGVSRVDSPRYALWAAPLSIAVAEFLLAVALVARLVAIARSRAKFRLPRVFWFWCVWAGAEVAMWARSADRHAGLGEIRHLLLILGLFVILGAIESAANCVAVWRGLFVTATIGSAGLIVEFALRMVRYRREILTSADPSFYLRSSGPLHHWMIYATVEVLVFTALVEFAYWYPQERRWTMPALAVNSVAILLSFTRILWTACLLVSAVHLIWRRSRRGWAIPAMVVVVIGCSPGPLRYRRNSFEPGYYSNMERLQMLRVGWRMVREHPLSGVGPGRVEELYRRYLSPEEKLPAYHGHLHNNAAQLAAEFGLPVLGAATAFLFVVFRELVRVCRLAAARDEVFVCRTALLGFGGFLVVGLADYNYGHSLGLVLLSFVALSPIYAMPGYPAAFDSSHPRCSTSASSSHTRSLPLSARPHLRSS